jgi:hypothetical protein
LNYTDLWLARSIGTYPDAVWDNLWWRYGRFQFRAEHTMEYTSPKVMKAMGRKDASEINASRPGKVVLWK